MEKDVLLLIISMQRRKHEVISKIKRWFEMIEDFPKIRRHWLKIKRRCLKKRDYMSFVRLTRDTIKVKYI